MVKTSSPRDRLKRTLVRPDVGLPIGLAIVAAACAYASEAGAQGTAPAVAAANTPVEVRVALSAAAAEKLSQQRFRRLLSLELDEDTGQVAPVLSGPLNDHVAYVWLDLPEPRQVLIEVRLAGRAVVRRTLSVPDRRWDVTARIIALTTAEMVRGQARPARRRKNIVSPKPTAEQAELAARGRPAWILDVGGYVAGVPSANLVVAGPTLGVGFRYAKLSQRLSATWAAGDSAAGQARWLEMGLGTDYAVWLQPRWRVSAGALATAATVHVQQRPAPVDDWSARGGANLGVETRLGTGRWLGLWLQPGAVLREANSAAPTSAISGAWLGLALTLQVEGSVTLPR